jgi:hypothetical protein
VAGGCDRVGPRPGKGFLRRAQVRLLAELVKETVVAAGAAVARQTFEQRDQAGTVDLLAQTARRGFFEVMGLVDDQVVVLRQQAATDLGVGEQQRVVDDDQVRGLRLRTRAMHVAVLFGAVDADAVQRVACDPRPQHLFAAIQSKLGPVAALRRMEPDHDLELEHQLFGVLARLREVATPPPQRHVVGPALQEARLEVPRQPLA